MPLDLNEPKDRELALGGISPELAKDNHELLRTIFGREIEYLKTDEDHEYFENLYWCAWLLFNVGDLADVERMWEAKNLNMDTGTGFDLENMVGAGVAQTVNHLRSLGRSEIAQAIEDRFPSDCEREVREWSESRRKYFNAI